MTARQAASPAVAFLQRLEAPFQPSPLKAGHFLSLQFCSVFYFCNACRASNRFRFRTKVEASMPRLAAAARTLPYLS